MKKLSGLMLGALTLTAALLIFAPATKAMFTPEIFVSPAKNKFYAPCVVSTEFDVAVKVWNQKEETGKSIYAFDFWFMWPNSTHEMAEGDYKIPFITLTKIEVKPPWAEGKYFIIANETNYNATSGKWENPELIEKVQWVDPWYGYTGTYWWEYWNWYHLAITALDKTDPLIDIKAPVVDLTFHIDDEPIYGMKHDLGGGSKDGWYAPLKLMNGTMSGYQAVTNVPETITPSLEDGAVWVCPDPPEMWLSAEKGYDEDLDGDVDFYYVVKWTNSTWFTVEVQLLNAGKMSSFHVKIEYNATLLNTDPQHIHIKDLLPPPYQLLHIYIDEPDDPWTDLATITIDVERPCEKPPVCGSGPLVNIDFHTKCPTLRDPLVAGHPGWWYTLPHTVATNITMTEYSIDCKYLQCGTYHSWYPVIDVGPPQNPMWYYYPTLYPWTDYNWVTYWFKPLPQDLDQSGHVDITDLIAIAKQYGKSTFPYAEAFAKLAAPTSGSVDLNDVVYVAKYFCKPYTPLDPYTGLPYDP